MSGEMFGYAAVLALVAVLPVLALRRRGIGFENGIKMVAAWLAIFVVVMILFTWLQP
jgi:hypothetical protein